MATDDERSVQERLKAFLCKLETDADRERQRLLVGLSLIQLRRPPQAASPARSGPETSQ